jgi:electron transfer flavoprotein alpha subunit
MAAQVFVYITHKDGVVEDSALELLAAAAKTFPDQAATAICVGAGANLDTVCREMAASFNSVWKVDNPALAYPNGEMIRKVLVDLLPENAVVFMAHNTFGMDVGPGLSIKLNCAFASDVMDIENVDGAILKIIRQEFGGQIYTHVDCDASAGAVINVRPGAFKPDERKAASGDITDKAVTTDLTVGRRFLEVIAAEAGDVDITASEILVSVGRGIEDEDNLDIISDLAEAMGGDVSCSRPIVDAKWMEKPRQVGTSGQTVKPKVYMALGISGSFQHMGGIKGSPYIVAVNKNPKAPIFQFADVGVVADILDFVPELTDMINETK